MNYYQVKFSTDPDFEVESLPFKPFSVFRLKGVSTTIAFMVSSYKPLSKRQFFYIKRDLPVKQVFETTLIKHLNPNLGQEYIVTYSDLCQKLASSKLDQVGKEV